MEKEIQAVKQIKATRGEQIKSRTRSKIQADVKKNRERQSTTRKDASKEMM